MFLLIGFAGIAWAEAPRFENSFRQGLAAHQAKSFEEAEKHFKDALSIEPRSVAALNNLALTYFETEKWGSAIAWYRRALAFDPGFEPARVGLASSIAKLEVKEIPHRIETFETLRTYFLQYVSLPQLLGLGVLFLLLSGWRLLSWLGARRRALQGAESAPPPFSVFTGTLIFLLALSLVAATLKAVDLSQPRGTIVAKKIEARSAPSTEAVTLFELFEGFEVLIGALEKDWVQVTYPGGLTGWIPRDHLIPTGGDF